MSLSKISLVNSRSGSGLSRFLFSKRYKIIKLIIFIFGLIITVISTVNASTVGYDSFTDRVNVNSYSCSDVLTATFEFHKSYYPDDNCSPGVHDSGRCWYPDSCSTDPVAVGTYIYWSNQYGSGASWIINYIDPQNNNDFDLQTAKDFFSVGFSFPIMFWLSGLAVGFIIKIVRDA